MRLINYLPLIVFIFLCGILYYLLSPIKQNNNFTDLNLVTVKGENLKLNKQETYIIRFFSSWCNYCKRDFPALINISKKLNAKIIGIAVNDTEEKAKNYIANNILPYNFIAIDKAHEYKKLFNNMAIPETIIIKNGEIIFKHVGTLK